MRREWEHNGPRVRAMVEADAAEARGDAAAALAIMQEHLLDDDGKPFWRPWRLDRLLMLAGYGPALPAWVTSRWVLEQSLQSLTTANRQRATRARQLAVELRGGAGALPGVDKLDAMCRVMDRDWVYRQLFLYELGGLEHFIRSVASADLLAGADAITDWSRSSMNGYRLLETAPHLVTWQDLATSDAIGTANIGSGVFVSEGECVIGRMVPSEEGPMFETPPQLVSERAALAVSQNPTGWLDALRSERSDPEAAELLTHGFHHDCFVSDVPRTTWLVALHPWLPRESTPETFGPLVARAVIDVSRVELDRLDQPRPPGEIDFWPCLGAAMLAPYVIEALPDVVTRDDVEVLRGLGVTLAPPASDLCNAVAFGVDNAA